MAGGTDKHRLRHYKPEEIVKCRRMLWILRQVEWVTGDTCELGLGEALMTTNADNMYSSVQRLLGGRFY